MKTTKILKFGAILSLLSLLAPTSLWSSDYSLDTETLCQGFPRARISSPKGTCVGVVATEQNGLRRPRRIVEIAPDHFLVTDMGGWAKSIGSLWSVKVEGEGMAHIERLVGSLDHLHGIAIDSRGFVYLGERGRITRFDPNESEIKLQTLVSDLPIEGKHPLTHMIFDREDRLIVNVGAPTDQCLTESGKPTYPCKASEGVNPEAALYRYTFDQGGVVLKKELLARGLRNSMGLAIHPVSDIILQAENNMDFKEEDHPAEELNIINSGSHYGWPYCYADGQLNPAYKKSLFNRGIPKIDCSRYQNPVALLPAHSAPLDMFFYQSDYFPELTGKLIFSFHGYRQYGHRLASIAVAEEGLVNSKLQDFVSDWDAQEGVRPKGSPVGMTEARDGKIWFVEDKNKTVMFVAKSDDVITSDDSVGEVTRLRSLSPEASVALGNLRDNLLSNRCTSCHSSLEAQNLEELHQRLFSEGFTNPKNPMGSELLLRVNGEGAGMQMPPGTTLIESEIDLVRDYLKHLEID